MAGVNSRGLEAGWIRITNLEEALAILIFMNGGLKRIAPGLIPNKLLMVARLVTHNRWSDVK